MKYILPRRLLNFTTVVTEVSCQPFSGLEQYMPTQKQRCLISTQFISTLSFLKSGRDAVNVTPHPKVEGEKINGSVP